MFIDQGITSLTSIFKKYPIDECHSRSHEVLNAIRENKENLYLLFKYFLKYKYDRTSVNSITGDFVVDIYRDNCFTLEMGIFSPHKSDYSYAMMHNHESAQLSTINIFGGGYSSLIFGKNYSNGQNDKVEMVLEKYKKHGPGNIEFIDHHCAHSIFFPNDLTITLVLWSDAFTKGNGLSGWYHKRKKIQRSRAKMKLLAQEYGLKNTPFVLQDWFYPKDGFIYNHPHDISPDRGVNFLNNLLFKLQEIHFPDRKHVFDTLIRKNLSAKEKEKLHDYYKKHPIEIVHEGDQMITEKRNVHIDEYKKCYTDFDFSVL